MLVRVALVATGGIVLLAISMTGLLLERQRGPRPQRPTYTRGRQLHRALRTGTLDDYVALAGDAVNQVDTVQ